MSKENKAVLTLRRDTYNPDRGNKFKEWTSSHDNKNNTAYYFN